MDQVQDANYCLQFENYKNTLCTNLLGYFNRKSFVNVTLICDGEAITAHQVVLSACSQFFENVLISRSESHPILVFTDVPKEHMELLLGLMYKGHISVSKELLPWLFKTAKKLQIRGLNYEEFDNAQTNLGEHIEDTTHNPSPVLIETLKQTDSIVQEGQSIVSSIEEQSLVKKEAPRWLTTKTSPVEKKEPKNKVINPFAVKSKSVSDSDSTIYDYNLCTPGPSKKISKKRPSQTVSSPLRIDSDVEIVDNGESVVIIGDTQPSDSSSEIQRKIPHCSKPIKASGQFSKVDYTSDESEIISSSPKKSKENTVSDPSADESEVTPTVLVNPAALRDTSNDENVMENLGSSKASPSRKKNSLVRDEDKDSTEPNRSKTQPTLNGEGITWRSEDVEEPFEGYCRASLHSLRSFCVLCRKRKNRCRTHINKHHIGSSKDTFSCQTCSKRFSRKIILEMHKCEIPKKKAKK